MKAITAVPESVRAIFTKSYVIPDFQRPYSWEKEQCEKLWDDIVDFYEQKTEKDEQYFLGNIVINSSSTLHNNKWEVVDGQQRLTTLMLLIKALHSRAQTVAALEECLKTKDPLTSALTNSLRLETKVISEDSKNLKCIILENGKCDPKSNLALNYQVFIDKIDSWNSGTPSHSNQFNALILTLLDRVVMLPIQCSSEDDALIIFETINNRGLSLSDADIFKAKLYHNTKTDMQASFITDWNSLENHDWLFRVLMHINRSIDRETGREIALRSYFTAKNNRLEDSSTIIRRLKIINEINKNWRDKPEVRTLWSIMDTYPNYYWNYPLFVFLHKHGLFNESTSDFYLSDDKMLEFITLLKATIRYFFIKGLVHNTVNTVKDAVFRVCVRIEESTDYLSVYDSNLTENDLKVFMELINSNQLRRYQRGIVLLTAYLNPNQEQSAFSDFISGKFDIEHILPKQWNHYDGWSESAWGKYLNTIGNLIPLQRELNIKAKNEFFERKKNEYRKSIVQDALDLLTVVEWTPEELMRKQFEKEARLKAFFRIE